MIVVRSTLFCSILVCDVVLGFGTDTLSCPCVHWKKVCIFSDLFVWARSQIPRARNLLPHQNVDHARRNLHTPSARQNCEHAEELNKCCSHPRPCSQESVAIQVTKMWICDCEPWSTGTRLSAHMRKPSSRNDSFRRGRWTHHTAHMDIPMRPSVDRESDRYPQHLRRHQSVKSLEQPNREITTTIDDEVDVPSKQSPSLC